MSLDPLKCTYLGYYISALRGCCALKFLHALEIDQALLAHTQRRTGVPDKNFNLENLKFALKFSVLPSITSGLLENTGPTKHFQSTGRKAGLINWVQFLEGPPPKICEGKKCPKFFAIFDNFRLWSRISPDRILISKIGKVVYQLQPLPRWLKERPWTLVHKRKSYWG